MECLSAGVIPMAFNDQRAAQLLAVCNDIGEAAYLDSQIAASLLDIFRRLPSSQATLPQLAARYGFHLEPSVTGDCLSSSRTISSINFWWFGLIMRSKGQRTANSEVLILLKVLEDGVPPLLAREQIRVKSCHVEHPPPLSSHCQMHILTIICMACIKSI